MLNQTREIARHHFLETEIIKNMQLQETLQKFAGFISKTTGFKTTSNIYEGIGLNGRRSIYCDFEGIDNSLRLYLEIITNQYGQDLFIIDFNLPIEIRGLRLGSRIICHLLSIVSALRIKKITLNPVNSRAENFWAKFGFNKTAGEKLMSLDLTKFPKEKPTRRQVCQALNGKSLGILEANHRTLLADMQARKFLAG